MIAQNWTKLIWNLSWQIREQFRCSHVFVDFYHVVAVFFCMPRPVLRHHLAIYAEKERGQRSAPTKLMQVPCDCETVKFQSCRGLTRA